MLRVSLQTWGTKKHYHRQDHGYARLQLKHACKSSCCCCTALECGQQGRSGAKVHVRRIMLVIAVVALLLLCWPRPPASHAVVGQAIPQLQLPACHILLKHVISYLKKHTMHVLSPKCSSMYGES